VITLGLWVYRKIVWFLMRREERDLDSRVNQTVAQPRYDSGWTACLRQQAWHDIQDFHLFSDTVF